MWGERVVLDGDGLRRAGLRRHDGCDDADRRDDGHGGQLAKHRALLGRLDSGGPRSADDAGRSFLPARPVFATVYVGGMSNELRGTVALVTGASSGIGEATARALADQGATVAAVARRKDRLDALTAEIGGLAIEADVTDREQARAAVDRTADELGRLDIVINNAGVMLLGHIVDAPVEEWDRMIELNLQGLLYVAHAALPHLLGPPRASRARRRPRQRQLGRGPRVGVGGGIYQATKHGVGVVQRGAAPGGHAPLRPVVADRAGCHRERAGQPRARRGARAAHGERRAEARGRGHRRRDRLHRHAARHVAINEVLVRPTEQVR